MKKIFVGIPTMGLIRSEAAHSLMELMNDLAEMRKDGYQYILAVMPRMLVAQARELAIEKALELKCDYVFMVDDDMIIPRNIVRRLLSHKKDIVGSMSFERMGDNSPNIYKLHSFSKDKKGKKEAVSMRWRNILDYERFRDKNGLVEVDVIGFGCVLINMKVFKKTRKTPGVQPPYFMSQFNVGEDFFFCYRAKEAGFRIYADTHPVWQCGHIAEPEVITEAMFKAKLNHRIAEEKKANANG